MLLVNICIDFISMLLALVLFVLRCSFWFSIFSYVVSVFFLFRFLVWNWFGIALWITEAAAVTHPDRYLAIATSGGLNQQRTGVFIFLFSIHIVSFRMKEIVLVSANIALFFRLSFQWLINSNSGKICELELRNMVGYDTLSMINVSDMNIYICHVWIKTKLELSHFAFSLSFFHRNVCLKPSFEEN